MSQLQLSNSAAPCPLPCPKGGVCRPKACTGAIWGTWTAAALSHNFSKGLLSDQTNGSLSLAQPANEAHPTVVKEDVATHIDAKGHNAGDAPKGAGQGVPGASLQLIAVFSIGYSKGHSHMGAFSVAGSPPAAMKP